MAYGPAADLPPNARYAREMARRDGYTFEDLDGGNGYLFRISRGGRSMLSGAGSINAYPVNSATAHSIARDKAHTKAVLRGAGIGVIPGEMFFIQNRFAALQPPGRIRADAVAYADRLGYPVFCKPNTGSRGDFAEIATSRDALERYLDRAAAWYDSVLVEPVIDAPEYRVLVFDGRAIYQARKLPPALTGDGRRTLSELLAALNAGIAGTGLSPHRLEQTGHTDPAHIPASGETMPLAGRRNLSGSGSVEELTLGAHPTLEHLAVDVAGALQLRIAAIDLFDLSGDLAPGGQLVIEANSNPSITALERTGHLDTILDLWSAMAAEIIG